MSTMTPDSPWNHRSRRSHNGGSGNDARAWGLSGAPIVQVVVMPMATGGGLVVRGVRIVVILVVEVVTTVMVVAAIIATT